MGLGPLQAPPGKPGKSYRSLMTTAMSLTLGWAWMNAASPDGSPATLSGSLHMYIDKQIHVWMCVYKHIMYMCTYVYIYICLYIHVFARPPRNKSPVIWVRVRAPDS